LPDLGCFCWVDSMSTMRRSRGTARYTLRRIGTARAWGARWRTGASATRRRVPPARPRS
jgi:hypothetical protein